MSGTVDKAAALEWKTKGNAALAEKRFDDAVRFYTEVRRRTAARRRGRPAKLRGCNGRHCAV
jgi:hypothetical protein